MTEKAAAVWILKQSRVKSHRERRTEEFIQIRVSHKLVNWLFVVKGKIMEISGNYSFIFVMKTYKTGVSL